MAGSSSWPASLWLAALAATAAAEDIWIVAVQPFTGGTWDGGLSMKAAGDIMLEQINGHSSLLAGHTLRVVWQDGQCEQMTGTSMLLKNIFHQSYEAFAPGVALGDLDADGDGVISPEDAEVHRQTWDASTVQTHPIGLLGPGCTDSAMELAHICYSARFPIISNSATQPALSDRSLYPNFFRSIVPDTLFSTAWIAMARMLNQSSVAAVVGETRIFASLGARLAGDAARVGVGLQGDVVSGMGGLRGLQAALPESEVTGRVAESLLELRQRVVVLVLWATTSRSLLCEASKIGYENAVYMGFGWLPHRWWTVEDTTCSAQQITEMATGLIAVNAVRWRRDDDTLLACAEAMSARSFREEWFARQGAAYGDLSMRPEGFQPVGEASATADALCMYALMVHEVLAQGVSLTSLAQQTQEAYDAAMASFSAMDFEGLQGRIRFDPSHPADPEGQLIVQQLQQEGEFVDIASYGNAEFSFFGTHDLRFSFNQSFPAGPAGATEIHAPLAPFRVCGETEVLRYSTNVCESCPHDGQVRAGDSVECVCAEGWEVQDARVNGGHAGAPCRLCPAGRFKDFNGPGYCEPCEQGTFSLAGAERCEWNCGVGQVPNENRTGCEDCPAGTHQAWSRMSEDSHHLHWRCDRCHAGRYSEAGAVQCDVCTNQVPNVDRTGCEDCQSMYVESGGECVPDFVWGGGTGAMLVLSVVVVVVLLPTFCCYRVPIDDITMDEEYDCVIIKTWWPHAIRQNLLKHPVQVPASFVGTGTSIDRPRKLDLRAGRVGFALPDIDALDIMTLGSVAVSRSQGAVDWMKKKRWCQSQSPYKVERHEMSGHHLRLLHAHGGPVKADHFESSRGFLHLSFPDTLRALEVAVMGTLHVPIVFFIVPVIALGACAAATLPGVPVLILCTVGVVAGLLCRVVFWCTKRRRPIQMTLNRYSRKILTRGRLRHCERGKDRAVRLEDLWDMRRTFRPYIMQRSMHYINACIVQPLTKEQKSSLAEILGPVEVQWFVSHYWSNSFRDFVDSLRRHANLEQKRGGRSWKDMAFWICTFSINQWRIPEEVGDGTDWKKSSFYKALRSGCCQGTVMVLDDEARPLKRAWCLFELLQTAQLEQECVGFRGLVLLAVGGVLGEREGNAGVDVALQIGEALETLKLEEAKASEPKDMEMIHNLVRQMEGGFPKMNCFIKEKVRKSLAQISDSFQAKVERMIDELARVELKEGGEHLSTSTMNNHRRRSAPADLNLASAAVRAVLPPVDDDAPLLEKELSAAVSSEATDVLEAALDVRAAEEPSDEPLELGLEEP